MRREREKKLLLIFKNEWEKNLHHRVCYLGAVDAIVAIGVKLAPRGANRGQLVLGQLRVRVRDREGGGRRAQRRLEESEWRNGEKAAAKRKKHFGKYHTN